LAGHFARHGRASRIPVFKRDIANATVRFFDTRHFAPETHAPEVAAAIRGFLP
jgi:hypothetical protein